MENKKKLIIIDELLQNIDGHNYEYIKSVKEIFEKENYDVQIYGNANVIEPIKKDINANPWFKFNATIWYRKIPLIGAILYRLQFWHKLYKQYVACITNINGTETEIFIPNIFWYNTLPIIIAIKKIKIPTTILFRTSIIDLFDAPKPFHGIIRKIYKYTNTIILNNSNIKIATDSSVIAQEWYSLFNNTMKVLPIPHIKPLRVNSNLDATIKNKKINFYAPGVMRLEKGMQLMYAAFWKIENEQVDLAKKIKWTLQIFGNRDKEIFENFRNLLTKFTNIEINLLGSLTSLEYNTEIQNADVILIPYDANQGYKARTSGVMCEAIGAQKPFITTQKTWMSEQGKFFNTGLFTANNDTDDLIKNIDTIINNYANYLSKAILAKEKFLEFHSKENFYSTYKLK